MDGKRHLTKSFLMNGPLSPDTPTAATMMMVNPAAVARLSTGAPTTGPGKSAGAVTGKVRPTISLPPSNLTTRYLGAW